ncbi:MAG: GDP-L-fucose synthase [Prochlorococcus marinus CUG1436]|nr:GDP-L-fucose synthase [Prochlorococcus marinus CUG1436]
MKKIKIDDKIFIAGASGMAGQAIHRSLIKSGYGNAEKGGAILTPSRSNLDCSDKYAVDKWLEINKPKVVIIASAKVGGIFANSSQPTEFLLENLKIQNNLIEGSWENNVKRLLFLGSSCIYPKYASQPIEEESLLTGPLEPTNEWYAIAKITGIKLCQALRKQYNFDAISLMPTNLYGPGDNYHPKNSHVMAALIRKLCEASINSYDSVTCWGTGAPYREFLHVDDLGDAAVYALENWDPDSSNAPLDRDGNPLTILNVGTGKDISIKSLALKIAKFLDYKGKILWDNSKPDGTPKKQLQIDKILELGWKPKISLDEGIRSSIKTFLKNK